MPSGPRAVAILKFAQRHYKTAVLTWWDFNVDPSFYDIETEIVIMYFNLRFEWRNLKSSHPVFNYELFKDRDLVFFISESLVIFYIDYHIQQ